MLPLPLLKSIDLIVAVVMLAQPVLAAVQPAVVRAAPVEAASQSAPEVATSVEPLTAAVPGPLLAGEPRGQVNETSSTSSLAGQARTTLETALQSAEWPPANADFTVNTRLDGVDSIPGDGVCAGPSGCTLRAAIMEANALPGAQTIALPGILEPYSYYQLTIQGTGEDAGATGDLDITDDLTLVGGGASTTIIDANHIDSVFHIVDMAHISGVTIQNGFVGIYGRHSEDLTLTQSVVRNNDDRGISGEYSNLTISNSTVSNNGGGGIYSGHYTNVTLLNTMISENSALGEYGTGGGVYADHDTEVVIINSTISGNSAGLGGGIYAYNDGEFQPVISLLNTTITNNSALLGGGGIFYANYIQPTPEDAVGYPGLVKIENTIIADNAGQDCLAGGSGAFFSPILTDKGHNLSTDDTCNLTDPTDIITANPGLGPLQDNGGPTPTHALLNGSPAVDRGNDETCPATDQRGVERPQGAACDIGAYEYDGPAILYGTTRRTGGGTDWPVDNYARQTQATVGNPINTASGNQTYETTDLRLPTPAGDITFSRSYSSFNAYYDSFESEISGFQYEAGSLGPGWMHNYETHLKFPFGDDLSKIGLLTPGANYVIFVQDETNPDRYTAQGVGGEIVRGEDELEEYFVYTSPEGIKMIFYDEIDGADPMDGYLKGRLRWIDFQLDGTIELAYKQYNSAVFDNLYLLDTVSASAGAYSMSFGYSTYQEDGYVPVARLTTLTLSDDRSVSFGHPPFTLVRPGQPSNYWSTNLTSFTDVRQKEWTYLYASEDTALALDYITYPHLSHFLVERQMPRLAGQSQGATIIQYRYQMAPDADTGTVPAARATSEINGAEQTMLSIEYGEHEGDPTIAHSGTGSAGPTVEYTYDGYGRLTQQQILDQLGDPIQGEGWQTEYPLVLQDPDKPYQVAYRPQRTTDPNGNATFYNWVDGFMSLGAMTNGITTAKPDGAYSFYQFVSEAASLHLPELIFYPYAADGTPQRIQTRLIYNTDSVANPVGDYEPGMPASQIPARIPNPYDVKTTLPKRLLLAREDDYDPATGQAKYVTEYHYYDAGPRKGLVQCVNSPIPGGDTYYDYNDARQPVDVYQGCDCTASGGHTGGLHTTITYDSLNRVETTTGPDGMVTRYQYVGQSDLVRVVTQHDNAGKDNLAEDSNGDTWNIKTAYFYDAAGRLLATIENYHPTYGQGTLVSPDLDGDGSPDSFAIDPAAPHINRATVYRYDAAGRVEQVTANYDGSNLENAASYYKEWPNSEERYNFATRSVYDGAGRVAAVIENYTPGDVSSVPARLLDLDGDGVAETELAISPDAPDRNRVTLNRYNALGRLKQVISPAWANASGVFEPYAPVDNAGGQTLTYNRITAYQYDAAGNVTKTIVNYKEGGSGDLVLNVSLEPGDVTPLHLSTDEPDVNLATCTQYDVLNRPVFTRAACVDGVGDYYPDNGNVYNRVTYTAYDALNRPIVVVGNYDGPADPPTSGDITLTPTATRNHVTRIYYDGLGRAEWVVQNMTGSTGRDIEEVLLNATSDGVDHNLITRAYYDEAGQQIAVVENYRSTDVMLEAGEIGDWLDEGYNHVTRTFYGTDGLPSAVTTNFVGDITSVTSPPAFAPGAPDRNLTTLYQDYDDLNRPVQVSINRWDDHLTSLVRYDNLGRVDWSIFDLDNQPRTTHADYANLGFSVTTEDPSHRLVRTTADVRGNPSTTVAPGTLDLTVETAYDLFGRVISSHDGVATHAAVETTYDALGQVLRVASDDLVTTYTYNLLGQVVIARTKGTSDGACSATAYQYDNAGQLLRVVENTTNPGGCGVGEVELPRDVETEYSYDEMGNLASVELAHDSTLANGSTKKFQYDALGQTTHEVLDPAGQKIFTQYCYDAAGSVTHTVRGSGLSKVGEKWEDLCAVDPSASVHLVTDYTYNALGQPTGIDYEETGDPLTSAKDVTITYDAFGNRETMAQTGGKTWHYAVDSDGLLDEVCPDWVGGACVSPGGPVSYAYDPAGNRTGLVVDGILDTRYKLDAAGRLECIDTNKDGACGSEDVHYTYDQASQVTKVETPDGISSDYAYDPLGRLESLTHKVNGVQASRFAYELDGLGNRTGATESVVGPTGQPLSMATFGWFDPDADLPLDGKSGPVLPPLSPALPPPAGEGSNQPSAPGLAVQSPHTRESINQSPSQPIAPDPTPQMPEEGSQLSTIGPAVQSLISNQQSSIPLAPGFYQETDANLTYSGAWTLWTGSGPSGGSIKYSNDPSAEISFAFQGTGLVLYRTLHSNRGPMDVCVDGACQTVENYAASLQWAQPVSVATGLANAIHQVTIRNTSSACIDLDVVEVLAPLPVLPAGYYEEIDGRLRFGGSWTFWAGSGPSGGSMKYTNQPGATIRFRFEGGKLTLTRSLHPNRGPMDVCIDGACETVQNYSASPLWQQTWTKSGLAAGVHEVVIRNTSTALIDLDAVRIEESGAPPPLAVGYYEETNANVAYSGAWTSWMGSGPSGGSMKYSNDPSAGISFTFEGNRLALTRTMYSNRGPMDVCIDGTCETVQNYSATLQWQQVWTSSVLSTGVHSVVIRNTSTALIDLDAVQVLGQLPVGVHQETHSAFTYSGTWTLWTGSGPSGGSMKYSNDPSASISFTFEGNRLALTRTTYSNRGPMDVCIDGACETVQNYSAALLWQQVWTSSVLSIGVHSVVIRNTSTALIDLDAVRVLAPLPVGVHQETDARIIYQGTWTDTLGSGPSGDTMKTTSDPNASAGFQFEGNKLTLYRLIGPGQGPMDVCIDGACEPVDNSAASPQWAQPWVKDGLSGGVHDAVIRNSGTGAISFDAAKITGSFAWRYHYDGLSRLVEACAHWNAATEMCKGDKFTYRYDEVGNLLTFTRSAGANVKPETVHFRVDDATNQVSCIDGDNDGECGDADDIAYSYDTLGNLLSDGVTTYTYDTANRLVRVVGPEGTTVYEYSGDGDRIAETHDGTRTDFTLDVASSLTQVLAETTNGQTISYLYGLGLVAQSMNGVTEHNLTDGLGSVRQTVDTDGRVLLAQTFDPYGSLFEQARGSVLWDAASPFGWTGEQSDPNGLTYLRARYYAPSMGRFTQLDPFAGALALPSSLNGYAYGHGNPTRYTDPEGLCGPLCWFAIIAVGATVLGGAAYAYEVHSNIQQGMDPWQAMYYNNINWRFVGAAAAVGAVIAPVAYLGYLCVMSGGWCVAAWEIVDYYDDMATMAAAAQGDPEAVGQMGIMAQLQLWPDLPVNFLFSKADNVAKYADEIGGAAKYADDVNWSGASDAFDVRPATGRFPDEVSVRPGGPIFRDSLRGGGSSLVAGTGGRFGDLDAKAVVGDNLTPHHMPQAAAKFTSPEEGAALVLPQEEHVLTRTYFTKGAIVYRQEANLSFRTRLVRDIIDIRNNVALPVYGMRTHYNDGLLEVIRYYKGNEIFSHLLAK